MAHELTQSGMFRASQTLRHARGVVFIALGLVAIIVAMGMLAYLVLDVLVRGAGWLDWQFLTSFDSRFAARAGIKAALYGTAFMMTITLLISLPLGVMSAVYLEEYAKDSLLKSFIQVNIANLAGILEQNLVRAQRAGLIDRDVDPQVAAWDFMAVGFTFEISRLIGMSAELDGDLFRNWIRHHLTSIGARRPRTRRRAKS